MGSPNGKRGGRSYSCCSACMAAVLASRNGNRSKARRLVWLLVPPKAALWWISKAIKRTKLELRSQCCPACGAGCRMHWPPPHCFGFRSFLSFLPISLQAARVITSWYSQTRTVRKALGSTLSPWTWPEIASDSHVWTLESYTHVFMKCS